MNTSYSQALGAAIMALNLCSAITAGGEDALNPRTRGDWDHDNAPVPAYRQNCHPAMTECQLPIRPITDDESDLNGRTRAGDETGTSPAQKDPRQRSSLKGREADLVAIKSVLDNLQHYNLHRVRFEGRVTRLTVLPNASGCGNFDAYLFHIDDGTGTIEVFDTGVCGEGGAYPPLLMWNPVGVGDRVAIAVSIVHSTHAPGLSPQAQLQWITRLPAELP